MTEIALDDLSRVRFEWPEPLVIELISDVYRSFDRAAETGDIARLHARFLRELVDGDSRRSAALRLDLIAACAGRGLSPNAIDGADRAVIAELIRVVGARFRNSPRLLAAFTQRFEMVRDRLPARPAPPPKPAPRSAFSFKPVQRAPLRLVPLAS